MVCHVLKHWPGHDLEKIAIHRSRNAVCRGWWTRARARRMLMIKILACSHDRHELCKRVASFWPPSFVRCQVAGDNVRACILSGWQGYGGTKVRAPTQVGSRIDLCRVLAKVRVSACGVVEVRRSPAGVASIAISYRVDQKAA